MSRSDRLPRRLDALQLALWNGDVHSVAELCARLQVSRRTLFRDLNSLRDRGLVIASDAGRGGGVRLERGRSPIGIPFTGDEVVALWLSAHLSRVAMGLPWSRAAQSGLARLLASLPRDRARELRALCQRVVVGGLSSPEVRHGATEPPPQLLGLFERAFTGRQGLAFSYRDRHGRASERRIEPHGLLVEPPVWYILAIDVARGEPRTFRMDRVSRPRLDPTIRFVPRLDVVREQSAHVAPDRPHPPAPV